MIGKKKQKFNEIIGVCLLVFILFRFIVILLSVNLDYYIKKCVSDPNKIDLTVVCGYIVGESPVDFSVHSEGLYDDF